jgi:DNA-binding NtrC family response regulator
MGHTWPGNVRELRNLAERLVVRTQSQTIEPGDLPVDVLRGSARPVAGAQVPVVSRADALFERMVVNRESFWTAVYPAFMDRDLTRDDLRAIVRKGLERTSGSYRVLTDLFNMPSTDYKRFLNFLRKHQCQEAFQPFRVAAGRPADAAGTE